MGAASTLVYVGCVTHGVTEQDDALSLAGAGCVARGVPGATGRCTVVTCVNVTSSGAALSLANRGR